jgi:hypothetical protein
MGYPTSVGVLLDVTETVAIRPEFTFSGGSNDLSDRSEFAVGLAALFYRPATDSVRTYVSPRILYSRAQTTSTSNQPISFDTTSSVTSVVGSVGAEYEASSRFGIFGEVGFGYVRSKAALPSGSVNTTAQSWGLRSGVGVIVRF